MHHTVIEITIKADSLGELRDQLQKALDEMGWAPVAPPAPPPPPPAFVVEWEAPAPVAEEKPRRTRKAKEEAPAEPAADPTSSSPSPAPAAEDATAASPSTEPGPQATAAPADATSPSTPAAPSSGLTHEGVKKRAEAWMNEHPDGVPEAKKQIRSYLASFGVSRVAELPAESLQDFLDTIEGV
jgi:hypothetical protein